MPKFLSTKGTSLIMRAVLIRVLMEKPVSLKEMAQESGMHLQTIKNNLRALHTQNLIDVTANEDGTIQYHMRLIQEAAHEDA